MAARDQQQAQPAQGAGTDRERRTSPSSRVMAHASVSQLTLLLPKVLTYQRLYVTVPGVPGIEGKYMRCPENPVSHVWVNMDKGSGSEVGRICYTAECWALHTPGAQAVSDRCASTTMPDQDLTWKLTDDPSQSIKVSSVPGRRFMWDTDITAIGDPQEFEVAILAGIQELEEHIYIAHKAAYIDNVGSMYRLPRNPQAETGGAPEDFRLFDIKDFLRYLYSPEGLGWLDGRPAVLAALIYMDRIRARGRIVSRRSVHRLLVSAVLIGHEYFTQVMKEAGVTNIEPAPVEQMCQMTFLTQDSIEPMVTRFKGMMDFEQAVLEQDVTSYCGALQGGVKLSDELIDEAKKVRVPGQQGLSSQQDGMARIRRWAEEVATSRSTPSASDSHPQWKPTYAAQTAAAAVTTPNRTKPSPAPKKEAEPVTPTPTPGPTSPEIMAPTPGMLRGQSPGSMLAQRSPMPGSPLPEVATGAASPVVAPAGDLRRLPREQLLEVAKKLNIDIPPELENEDIIKRVSAVFYAGTNGGAPPQAMPWRGGSGAQQGAPLFVD
eukprot:TRINITY_DN1835_c0_g2_i1.p1 TRINITY_DN1835_c0_g2~~TRINITY_DN1835_c0_g2_i1.p1  ORF type:complete len:568 (+),score=178.17 TRINITY_DN1835_c0_g2_i1:65-1705(+)